ncbi:MAG: hypothetical protein ACT4NT_05750 [Nitrososphaerota archaeon]
MLAEASTIQEVEISKLQNSPIQVTLHSAKTIEQIAIAAENPQQRNEFPPIKVATLQDSMFVVDGHAIEEGFKLANVKTIKAIMYRVESINDVLALHVKFNQHSPLDPFELVELINFMLEHGESPSQIKQKLQLKEHLAKLIGCRIANREAKNRLKNFVHDISIKYSNVIIPPYFTELVSKVPEKIQLDVVEQFISIMDHTMSDRKFAFPGPETLEVYFKQYLKNKEREPIFFKQEITQHTKTQISESVPGNTKIYSIRMSPKEKEKATDIISAIPGMAILKVEKPGLYRVNMVKKIIAPIREVRNLTVIQGDEGQKIFSLPPKAVEFLDMKDDSDTSKTLVKTLTTSQLKKFVAKLPDKRSRFVVISNTD